jgi:hypothetical protein
MLFSQQEEINIMESVTGAIEPQQNSLVNFSRED